jgi:BMFP domain-containing protein YqiC
MRTSFWQYALILCLPAPVLLHWQKFRFKRHNLGATHLFKSINLKGVLTMLNAKIFDDITAKLSQAAESGPAKDIEKNVRALLTQGFSKLDLVTREEFDIQSQVLLRAREQLSALEARVAALEAQRDAVEPN